MRWIRHMYVAAFDCAQIQKLLCCVLASFVPVAQVKLTREHRGYVLLVLASLSELRPLWLLTLKMQEFPVLWLFCGHAAFSCTVTFPAVRAYYQAASLRTDRNLSGSTCTRSLSGPSLFQRITQSTGTLNSLFYVKCVLQSRFLVLHHICDISMASTGELIQTRVHSGRTGTFLLELLLRG